MSIYTIIVNVILVKITIFPPAFRNKVIVAFFIVGSPLGNFFPVESALLGQDCAIFVVSCRNPISTAGGFKQNQHIFFDLRRVCFGISPLKKRFMNRIRRNIFQQRICKAYQHFGTRFLDCALYKIFCIAGHHELFGVIFELLAGAFPTFCNFFRINQSHSFALHAFFDQLRQSLILGAGLDIPTDLVHRQVPRLGFLDLHAVVDAQNAVIRVAEGRQVHVGDLVDGVHTVPATGVLGCQHAHHFQLWVVILPDGIYLLADLVHAVHRPLVTVHRDDHPVCGSQRIDGSHVDVRRAVDNAVVIVVADGVQRLAQPVPLRAHHVQHDVFVGQQHIHVAGCKIDVLKIRLHDHILHFGVQGEHIAHGLAAVGKAVEKLGGVALLVQIHHQHPPGPDLCQQAGEVAGGDGFPHAALQVDDCDFCHCSHDDIPILRFLRLLRPAAGCCSSFLQTTQAMLCISCNNSASTPYKGSCGKGCSLGEGRAPRSRSQSLPAPTSAFGCDAVALCLIVMLHGSGRVQQHRPYVAPDIVDRLCAVEQGIQNVLDVLAGKLVQPLADGLRGLRILPDNLDRAGAAVHIRNVVQQFLQFLRLVPALQRVQFQLLPEAFQHILPCGIQSIHLIRSALLARIDRFPYRFPYRFPVYTFCRGLDTLFVGVQFL
nr:MAG TPA: hypothetical protein [Bacteriophage sp.]